MGAVSYVTVATPASGRQMEMQLSWIVTPKIPIILRIRPLYQPMVFRLDQPF